MSNLSFLGALLIFALCEHFSDIFVHRDSQHQERNKFSKEENMTKLNEETLLQWPVWRQERVLKKLWREYYDLSEETLLPYMDSKINGVENIVDILNVDNDLKDTARVDIETDGINNKTDIAENTLEADYQLFAITFRAKKHFDETMSHKRFLQKVFDRVGGKYFPHVTIGDVTRHDYSKVGSFTEVVGYTERWIWKNVESKSWQIALQHHYKHNSHHPEFHVDSNGVKRGNTRRSQISQSL